MEKLTGRGCEAPNPEAAKAPLQKIERAIITKYRKTIWSKFTKAIKDFELIKDGDRIAVAVSGGKDSTLMAKLLQELSAHGPSRFELEFIAMDPGYHHSIRKL